MTEISKHGGTIRVSGEVLAAHPFPVDLHDRLRRAMEATPQERAEWARKAAEQAAVDAAERARDRNAAPVAAVTVEALLAKLGWGPQYAKHVVQPYCTCGDDIDGWSLCQHARDLDLEAWK